MERTYCLRIAYDGTEFHGWQHQPGLRTVQGVIEQAVRRVVRHQANLAGSGRTDAGVHAAGQVASFVSPCKLPPSRLRYAIGARLPKDVSVLMLVREVQPDFHATHRALSKLYRYRIFNARHRPVEQLCQHYTYHFWQPIDLDRMRHAARAFLGEQDFTSMASRGQPRSTMVRTVLRCDIERHRDEIRFDIEGTGFLYNQVRNMVGTLIEVGRGRWEPDRVATIMAARDRQEAGPTVPARGLSLRWVHYPAELLRTPEHAEPPADDLPDDWPPARPAHK